MLAYGFKIASSKKLPGNVKPPGNMNLESLFYKKWLLHLNAEHLAIKRAAERFERKHECTHAAILAKREADILRLTSRFTVN